MTSSFGSRVLSLVAFALLGATARTAEAQICRGMPSGGGVAFALGSQYLGPSYGVAFSKGAIAAGYNSLSSDTDVSGWDANIRFSAAMGGSSFKVCPSLGIDYATEGRPIADGSEFTARIATAAAGLAFGYEQRVGQGVSVVPFVGVDYHFKALVYSLSTEDSDEDELSGDTLSYVNIQYGGLVQYKSFYAGFAADRSTHESGGLYRTRLLLGFAFGGGSKSARQSPAPRTPVRRDD